MNLRPPRLLTALAAALAAALAVLPMGCVFEEGPSTETGNPNLEGTVRDAEGRPSLGTVRLYRLAGTADPDSAALLPPVSIGLFTTGGDGKYHFDALPRADYAIEAVDGSGKLYALKPRIAFVPGRKTLVSDLTLKGPAELRGTVTRGPNGFPPGITDHAGIRVRLGGADRVAVTDSAGRYAVKDVPEGVYRIAFTSPDGPYEPAFLDTVRAPSGVTKELPLVELPWSRFLAPPAPGGLVAAFDSLSGTVRLTWRPVQLANLAFYEVVREVVRQVARADSLRADTLAAGGDAVFTTTDTAFIDTLAPQSVPRTLIYRITAVNALGNRSPVGPAQSRSAVVPAQPDTVAAATGYLAGVAIQGSAPMPGAKVKLYAVPAAPGSPDSMPLPVRLLDSAVTGADGRYRFRGLGGTGSGIKPGPGATEGHTEDPMGSRYAVTASMPSGAAAIRMDLAPRADSLGLDTLALGPTGSVEGQASRDLLWVRTPFKSDEDIPVHLAGTPYAALTRFGSVFPGATFTLEGVPAGHYRLVVQANPEGYFLADTLDVTVAPGARTLVPALIKARYNPSAPPPKIASLAIAAGTRSTVRLTWSAIGNYPPLKGYRILRLDANLKESAGSDVLTATEWTDDVSGLPSGSTWSYVARVVNQAGRESENGGDAAGLPVPFTLP